MASPIDPAVLTPALANAMHVGTSTIDAWTDEPEIIAGGSAYVVLAHGPADSLAICDQLAGSGWRLTSTLRDETAGSTAAVWTRT